MAMQIQVNDIRIKKRVRRDLGNLQPLMESMRKHGLLNPILVTPKNELVAGHRRLESAKRLGWHSVTAQIVENTDSLTLLEIEFEENAARKDFSSDEMADALNRMERLKNPGLLKRFLRWITRILRCLLFWKRR